MFVDYERRVVSHLLAPHLPADDLAQVIAGAELVSLEHTGVGYYLTVRHPALPGPRVICNVPMLAGSADGVECGFVAFLEGGELTLECHSWGTDRIPDDVRNRPLEIRESDR